jgi:uncharacterized protein (DUF58 family)
VRPRRRAFALSGGAALLFAVGTSVQAGWVLVLAASLLGGALAGLVLPRRMTRGIEVERRAPAEAFQGEEVTVDLIVTNLSRGVRLAVEIRDTHIAPAMAFLSRVVPGETVVARTRRAAARRGVHEGAGFLVASAAPFGVAESRRRLPASDRTVVYPRVEALDRLPFLRSSATTEQAMHVEPRRGGGPEYLGIREYRTGDSLRHVHWRSTARRGELMVREFEREQTRRVVLVVDSLTDAGDGRRETPLDRCCSIAASIAFAAHAAGQGVRMVSAAAGEPISLSRAEPQRILRWLADLRPGGGLPLAELLVRLGDEILGAETVALVLPTWRANEADAVGRSVRDLCRRVPATIAILVDASTFEDARRAPQLDRAAIAGLERSIVAGGARIHRVGASTDLRTAFGAVPVA